MIWINSKYETINHQSLFKLLVYGMAMCLNLESLDGEILQIKIKSLIDFFFF